MLNRSRIDILHSLYGYVILFCRGTWKLPVSTIFRCQMLKYIERTLKIRMLLLSAFSYYLRRRLPKIKGLGRHFDGLTPCMNHRYILNPSSLSSFLFFALVTASIQVGIQMFLVPSFGTLSMGRFDLFA